MAAARYAELVKCHREALADHATEFWLGIGADPKRSGWLMRYRRVRVPQTIIGKGTAGP
jgi:hypothetical protein